MQVVDVYAVVAVGVAGEDEYLSSCLPLGGVELWVMLLFGEQRRLYAVLRFLGIWGITCADEPLNAEQLEVKGEEPGKVAPLGVVAWQQDSLVTEHVGVVSRYACISLLMSPSWV